MENRSRSILSPITENIVAHRTLGDRQPDPVTLSVPKEQRAVFEFLQDPATYGRADPVARIDTHGAAVFLAGPDVYKVKRAVRFPFMDFSTLERRRAACEAEIVVNRTNAPALYLEVVPIVRAGDGLRLGGDGETVEWAIHMRRFDENATFDRLAARGELDLLLIDRVAHSIVVAHRKAPCRDPYKATTDLRRVLTETMNELAGAPDIFPPRQAAALEATLIAVFDQAELLLLRRGARGQVRRCHGDLHLGNLVLIGGEPVLFDAIEFDEAIATCDVLYDLAFLVMDLCERGARIEANRLLNRYLADSPDQVLHIGGLAALPLFLSLRAAIRAKVTAALFYLDPKMLDRRKTAIGYFDAARRFVVPASPRLLAVGGPSGTGKSTLAAAVAPWSGREPGAIHLRSDVERKHLFGVPETKRLPEAAYRPDVSAAVYGRLESLAEKALRAGQTVIIDATFLRLAERDAIAAVAKRVGTPFCGIWLEAPVEVLLRRVKGREGDASDATETVVATQSRKNVGPITWSRVDASQRLETLINIVLGVIQRADSPASG